mgnify:CR=1 FL=1
MNIIKNRIGNNLYLFNYYIFKGGLKMNKKIRYTIKTYLDENHMEVYRYDKDGKLINEKVAKDGYYEE